MELILELSEPVAADQHVHIVTARFLAKGCAPVIAVADAGCARLEGLTVEQARRLSTLELDREIGPLPPSKRHAYLLFLECLAGALDRQNPNQNESKGQEK